MTRGRVAAFRALVRWVTCGFLVLVGAAGLGGQSSSSGSALIASTDRKSYGQGDLVTITVTNASDKPVAIVDRPRIDGGFAAVERRFDDGRWQAIVLYAVANVSISKTLAPGAQHRYVWPTVGYNAEDTIAAPGTYRVRFGQSTQTNPFEIRAK